METEGLVPDVAVWDAEAHCCVLQLSARVLGHLLAELVVVCGVDVPFRRILHALFVLQRTDEDVLVREPTLARFVDRAMGTNLEVGQDVPAAQLVVCARLRSIDAHQLDPEGLVGRHDRVLVGRLELATAHLVRLAQGRRELAYDARLLEERRCRSEDLAVHLAASVKRLQGHLVRLQPVVGSALLGRFHVNAHEDERNILIVAQRIGPVRSVPARIRAREHHEAHVLGRTLLPVAFGILALK